MWGYAFDFYRGYPGFKYLVLVNKRRLQQFLKIMVFISIWNECCKLKIFHGGLFSNKVV